MASIGVLAKNAHDALEKAVEVVEEHGRPERLENLQNITIPYATTRNPDHLASFQAELCAALAEIIEVQDARIEALEKAAKPASSSKKNK